MEVQRIHNLSFDGNYDFTVSKQTFVFIRRCKAVWTPSGLMILKPWFKSTQRHLGGSSTAEHEIHNLRLWVQIPPSQLRVGSEPEFRASVRRFWTCLRRKKKREKGERPKNYSPWHACMLASISLVSSFPFSFSRSYHCPKRTLINTNKRFNSERRRDVCSKSK